MRWVWLSLVIVLLLAACSMRAGSTASLASDLSLRDQSIVVVVEALARATSRPMAIDADAAVNARCARVTLVLPAGTSYDQAMRTLASTLVPAGLRLEAQGAGAVVRSIPNAPVPRGCESVARLVHSQQILDSVARSQTPDSASGSTNLHLVGLRGEPTTVRSRMTRAELSAALDNPRTVLQARVVPRMNDGRTIGAALYGIQPGTLLTRLGFENGDVVTHVNGVDLSSVDLWNVPSERLRGRDHLSIVGMRRQAPLTIEIDIVR